MTHSLVVDWDPEDGGEAMITEDPQFVRPGEWDDAGTPDDWTDDIYLEGDYHLLLGPPPSTPAILPSTGIRGRPTSTVIRKNSAGKPISVPTSSGSVMQTATRS